MQFFDSLCIFVCICIVENKIFFFLSLSLVFCWFQQVYGTHSLDYWFYAFLSNGRSFNYTQVSGVLCLPRVSFPIIYPSVISKKKCLHVWEYAHSNYASYAEWYTHRYLLGPLFSPSKKTPLKRNFVASRPPTMSDTVRPAAAPRPRWRRGVGKHGGKAVRRREGASGRRSILRPSASLAVAAAAAAAAKPGSCWRCPHGGRRPAFRTADNSDHLAYHARSTGANSRWSAS